MRSMDEMVAISVFALAVFSVIGLTRMLRRGDPRRGEPGLDEHSGATGDIEASAGEAPGDEMRMALIEVANERDVSIARASQAEEGERLARERLTSLAPLELRVEVAERRALDAERRLEEIAERVDHAERDVDHAEREGDGSEAAMPEPSDAAASAASELRARLARTVERKEPPGDDR